ncbi:unnamed protein product [Onchocerca ochengi]|uniref:Protein kinase domain-containing protein n=1 Tax=Onchocerca ochengi TaxID=42157 RepID=A0A182E1R4_ONCOC|nr:unnamed protein product [Onchocerca ochengi]
MLEEILALTSTASRMIVEDGASVDVEVPVKVVGDIHGQYEDMHKLFGMIGKVPDVKMIFLGDYVDRGPQSIETIIYLLCLKVKYRDCIYLLRSNHETPAVNRIYGFYNECALKYKVDLWRDFQSFSNRMLMAGLISKRVPCMHGGLSPHLTSLEQIRQIKHPCEPLVVHGYELMVGKKLITIFSAPNYAGQFNNARAVVCIDDSSQSGGSEEVETARLKVEEVSARGKNNKTENNKKDEKEEKRGNVTKAMAHVVKQTAEEFGTRETNQVELVMEDLHLFSNGIFSNVYKGLLRQPQHRLIAIKKSWSDQSNQKSMEVQILTMLNRFHHKNIIRLLYKFSQSYPDQKICTALVFDFFPMNLHEVRERYGPLSILDVKLYIWQLFRGQAHLEKNNVCHRDIKPQNLLVDHKSGMLKISDFGSSKIMHEKTTSYHYHVTRYYRAPELILGSVQYRCEIDRWSCGCVFGELLKNHVLFPGRTTHHQLQLVINILGYPSSHDITAMRATTEVLESDDFRDDITKKRNSHGFKKLIKGADHDALNLLAQVLVYDPISRLSGPRFLENSYFNELFDPHTRRNGQRIKVLSEKVSDLKCAVAGDEVLPKSVTTEISETSDTPSK